MCVGCGSAVFLSLSFIHKIPGAFVICSVVFGTKSPAWFPEQTTFKPLFIFSLVVCVFLGHYCDHISPNNKYNLKQLNLLHHLTLYLHLLFIFSDLQDFRDAVSKASAQSGKPVIEERVLNQILYSLPQLYELNENLLKELKERVAKWYVKKKKSAFTFLCF